MGVFSLYSQMTGKPTGIYPPFDHFPKRTSQKQNKTKTLQLKKFAQKSHPICFVVSFQLGYEGGGRFVLTSHGILLADGTGVGGCPDNETNRVRGCRQPFLAVHSRYGDEKVGIRLLLGSFLLGAGK